MSTFITPGVTPPIIATMSGARREDVSWFSHGTGDRDEVEDRLDRYLRSGSVRPEWCFIARTPGGRVLARHWWWAAPGSSRPAGVDLVSVENHDSAAALLRLARDQLEVNEAVCELTVSVDHEPSRASETRGDWGSVLSASGFAFDVARVRVEWGSEGGVASSPRFLEFHPAHRLDDKLLVRLFEAVADDPLEHSTVSDRALGESKRDAQERLAKAQRYGPEPDWFTVGCAHGDIPVGYVVPALIDEVAVVAEIGVARRHRGHGYGLDLLLHAVRLLDATGAERIVADTDQANTAMRATFARAGFAEREYRDCYCWQRP